MKYELIHKGSFRVIGVEGSTNDGAGFIPKLYESLKRRSQEIERLIKKNSDGTVDGTYGLMSDFSHSFKPWEDDFSSGLYLAGFELKDEVTEIPDGWTVWAVKEQDYLLAELEKGDECKKVFSDFISFYLPFELKSLSGAVFDYYSAKEKQTCLLFPVVGFRFRKLPDLKLVHIASCGLAGSRAPIAFSPLAPAARKGSANVLLAIGSPITSAPM